MKIGFTSFERRLYQGIATCDRCEVEYRLHDHIMGDTLCLACCAADEQPAGTICYFDEVEGETYCRPYTPMVR